MLVLPGATRAEIVGLRSRTVNAESRAGWLLTGEFTTPANNYLDDGQRPGKLFARAVAPPRSAAHCARFSDAQGQAGRPLGVERELATSLVNRAASVREQRRRRGWRRAISSALIGDAFRGSQRQRAGNYRCNFVGARAWPPSSSAA